MIGVDKYDSLDKQCIEILSSGRLTIPSTILGNYICDAFAILYFKFDAINNTTLPFGTIAQFVLKKFLFNENFLCSEHLKLGINLTNKTISNIFFDNKRNLITDGIFMDNIVGFKKRLRNKQD